MKPIEKIMKFVNDGDLIPVLAEEDFVDCFIELRKYGLIDIVDEKIILTEKGEKAKEGGLEEYLTEIRMKEELWEFSPEVQKKEYSIFKWCAFCLFLAIVLIATGLMVWF